MNHSATHAKTPIEKVVTTCNGGEVKYVFVCGLHRSGTSILAQKIGQLKNCTGFGTTGAGLLLDEGQYLQDVYPPDTLYGGVGKFGFTAQAHLTEYSPLLTPSNVSRLRQTWENHWDRDKTIRVEKTPGNLLKTRFLQAAFPDAHFIVIKRHPVPVSLATQKWSRSPLHDLFKHWLRCHEIFDEDKKHLEHLYELSYEDYIKNPKKYLEEIADFIGTEIPGSWEEGARDIYNTKYLDRWARMLQSSPFRLYYRHVATMYERRFAKHGYSIAPLCAETALSLDKEKLIVRSMGTLLCLGWDAYSVLWRADRRCKNRAKQVARRYLPEKLRRGLRSCQAKVRGL
jgi:hypothetical protein